MQLAAPKALRMLLFRRVRKISKSDY